MVNSTVREAAEDFCDFEPPLLPLFREGFFLGGVEVVLEVVLEMVGGDLTGCLPLAPADEATGVWEAPGLPVGLPTDFPADFPSGFPSGFAADFPADFRVDFPAEFGAEFGAEWPVAWVGCLGVGLADDFVIDFLVDLLAGPAAGEVAAAARFSGSFGASEWAGEAGWLTVVGVEAGVEFADGDVGLEANTGEEIARVAAEVAGADEALAGETTDWVGEGEAGVAGGMAFLLEDWEGN